MTDPPLAVRTDLLALGRAVLDRQPFSRLLGTTLEALEPGRAELRLSLRPEHMQQNDTASATRGRQ